MHDLSYSIKENNGRIRKLSEYLLVCKVERYFLQINTIFCCPVHLFIKNIFSKFYGKVGMYIGYFSISFEKITFYTEILPSKVDLWIFSLVSLVKKHHKTTFPVKISV